MLSKRALEFVTPLCSENVPASSDVKLPKHKDILVGEILQLTLSIKGEKTCVENPSIEAQTSKLVFFIAKVLKELFFTKSRQTSPPISQYTL